MAYSLERVAARAEIIDALMTYCRALDRMDRELAESIWRPEATVEYRGYFTGTALGFLDWVWPGHASLECHAHQITNMLVDVQSAERATSEAYVTVLLRGRSDGGPPALFGGVGRYLDTWAHHAGRWVIASRVYLDDLPQLTGPVSDVPPSGSARDHTDPSYTVLGW